MPRLISAACAAVALLLLSGCGGSGSKLPASGAVNVDGSPLSSGVIQFVSADAAIPCTAGGEITSGRYSIPAASGLLPGKYIVRISAPVKKDANAAPRPDGSFEVTETLAARYNASSELTAEVAPGAPAVLDFDLKAR